MLRATVLTSQHKFGQSLHIYIYVYNYLCMISSRRSNHGESLFHPSFCVVPAAYLLPICLPSHDLNSIIIHECMHASSSQWPLHISLRFESKQNCGKYYFHLLKLLESPLISFIRTYSLHVITKAKRPINTIIVSAHVHT